MIAQCAKANSSVILHAGLLRDHESTVISNSLTGSQITYYNFNKYHNPELCSALTIFSCHSLLVYKLQYQR
jgi:hypothetical protein